MSTTAREIDFSSVVAQLKGSDVDPQRIAQLLCDAVTATYRRLVVDDPTVRAELDFTSGTVRLVGVVDGEPTPVDFPTGDVARQAAQAARKAVARHLAESEIERVIRNAEARRTQLIDTIVESPQGKVWMLRMPGDAWALLPPEEQIASEKLERAEHLKVVILGGRRRAQDAVTVVSRTHPVLVQRLLEREVPELIRGEVIIKGIAREPGLRTKVAVASTVEAIDARGACIGPKGVRHRAVTSELGAEQLQIIRWTEDPATFVGNALAPAEPQSVSVDAATHTARIVVAPDRLSLAIGRGGENARLVARLTGWRVDIVTE